LALGSEFWWRGLRRVRSVENCVVCAAGCRYASVAAAVARAAANERITIVPGTYDADLAITRNLTLTRCGEAGDVVLRNASAGARAVKIREGITVGLEHVTISINERFESGGGIDNAGTLHLGECTVRDVKTESFGGGTVNTGEMTVTGGTITDNFARINGGGIFNRGTLALQHCLIRTNRADDDGGGIANDDLGSMIVTDCEFAWNDAKSGGAILNRGDMIVQDCKMTENSGFFGGALFNRGRTAAVMGSTISENNAFVGGGIANVGSLALEDSDIGRNKSSVGGVGGGGVFNTGELNLDSCAIEGNTASAGRGGGIYNAGGSVTFGPRGGTVTGNVATEGGGVYSEDGTVTLGSTVVSGNAPDNCIGTPACAP
jgi:hypothetical protein